MSRITAAPHIYFIAVSIKSFSLCTILFSLSIRISKGSAKSIRYSRHTFKSTRRPISLSQTAQFCPQLVASNMRSVRLYIMISVFSPPDSLSGGIGPNTGVFSIFVLHNRKPRKQAVSGVFFFNPAYLPPLLYTSFQARFPAAQAILNRKDN